MELLLMIKYINEGWTPRQVAKMLEDESPKYMEFWNQIIEERRKIRNENNPR